MDNKRFIKNAGHFEELADRWLAGATDVEPTALEARISVEEVLNRLLAAPEDLTAQELYAFSDLTREDAARVSREWSGLPIALRQGILRTLVELAEEDISLHLTRLLRIALEDEDAEVRSRAIDGLWEEADSNLVGVMVQILQNDTDLKPRLGAARILGNYVLMGELDEMDAAPAMRAEEALMSLLLREDEPLELRCRALEGLAYSGETGLRQLIEDAYYAPEEELRVSSLVAMGRSADIRWRAPARAELQNPSALMRAAAAKTAGQLEDKAAVNDLADLLTDAELDVRLAAIGALGTIGGKTARELLEAVRLGDDPDEVEAADDALEELMFNAGAGSDITLLDGDGEPINDEDEFDDEPWQSWNHFDNRDLGSYDE